MQALLLHLAQGALLEHVFGAGHHRLPARRLGQGVQAQVFVEGAGLGAGSVHVDAPQLALLRQHYLALAGALLPGLQGEAHGVHQGPAQGLVILLANEVVGQRSELPPQPAQFTQQLAIFDDGLARQALEGVLQRHHPVVILALLGAEGEGEGVLTPQADGQGPGIESVLLARHQEAQILLRSRHHVGPLARQRGRQPLVQRQPLHGFRLLAQQAGQGAGGKQHHPLLVDEDHGVCPFPEQRQQPLLILMQLGLQAQAVLYLLLEQVIFHQGGAAGAGLQQGPDPGKQLLLAEGFHQVVVGPGVEALFDVLGLVEGGEQQHRQLVLGMLLAQPAADVEARQGRHHHIQQYEIHRLLGQLGQGVVAVAARQYAIAAGLQQVAQYVQVDGLVIHHQDEGGAWWGRGQIVALPVRQYEGLLAHQLMLYLAAVEGQAARLAAGERQGEGEGGADARLALHEQLPPHQVHQLAGDGKPEPGPLLAHFRAHLHQGLEDVLQVVLGDADAGVCHPDAQEVALHQGAQHHLALGRVLDGVAHQVVEHLFEALFVRQYRRQLRRAYVHQGEGLGLHQVLAEIQHQPDHPLGGDGLRMDLQLAVAHLVVVEQIVHQPGQAVGALDDEAELFLLPLGEILLAGEHGLGHPLDAVDGGAQLVGGVGQQLVFQLVRLLQAEVLLVGQLDLLLQLLGLALDELYLVFHRALHVAECLGQPVDVVVGAGNGDGVLQGAIGHLLGGGGEGSQRRRDGVGEPAGEQDQQQQ
ncbi:hypothetical protein D3C86_1023820 [compost metagenome]